MINLVPFTIADPTAEEKERIWINPEKVIGVFSKLAKQGRWVGGGRVEHSFLVTQIIYGQETEHEYGCFAVDEPIDVVVGLLTKGPQE